MSLIRPNLLPEPPPSEHLLGRLVELPAANCRFGRHHCKPASSPLSRRLVEEHAGGDGLARPVTQFGFARFLKRRLWFTTVTICYTSTVRLTSFAVCSNGSHIARCLRYKFRHLISIRIYRNAMGRSAKVCLYLIGIAQICIQKMRNKAPNQSPEPTAVGAVHATSRRHLGILAECVYEAL